MSFRVFLKVKTIQTCLYTFEIITNKKFMSSKKEIIIETAFKMFCYQGFNAVGVNDISKQLKINKMTLYYYFKNKEELILATLEYAHNLFVKNILNKIDKSELSAKEKVLKLFTKLIKINKNKDRVRCIFINASAEFPSVNSKIRQYVSYHKKHTEEFIERILQSGGYKNSQYLSRLITVLSQGSLVMAQVSDDKEYYNNSRKILREIL